MEPFSFYVNHLFVSGSVLSRCRLGVALIGKTESSDGNFIVERFPIPVVAYGPGNDTGHATNEYVEIQDLVDCTWVLAAANPRLANHGEGGEGGK